MTELERLEVVLRALLPADGMPIARNALAKATCLNRGQVAVILDDDVMAGRVAYDLRTDSYQAVKQGDAL
jgi:hypothetical protein